MSYVPASNRFKKKRMAEINVVPYIDVMLVLLVIFMVTAPLLAEGVKVDLPQTTSRPLDKVDQEPVIVTVDVKGKYYLNIGETPEQSIDDQTLVARVAAVLRHRKGADVLIRGDQSVEYGKVILAMSLLQKAGVNNIGLVTEPPKKQRRQRK